MPRTIHFMFRKTVAKKERGKRKDEGGGREKKAGGKGMEMRKNEENVGMEGKKGKYMKRQEKKGKGITNICFFTICENNITKAVSF